MDADGSEALHQGLPPVGIMPKIQLEGSTPMAKLPIACKE
jgi:hypothetical protein